MNETELKQWEVDAAFALFRRFDRLATSATGRQSRAYRRVANRAFQRYQRLVLKMVLSGRATSETSGGGAMPDNCDTARSVARFNYSEPPPDPLAGQIKPWSELLEGTVAVQVDDGYDRGEVVMLAWLAPGGGRAHLYLRHHTGATPFDDRNRHKRARVIGALDERAIVPRTEEQAVAAVWARWRMKNDPPGLRVARAPGVQTHVEQRWFVEVIGAPGVGPVAEDGGLFLFELDARRAAWKWYDDRLEFEPEDGALLEDHDGAPVPAAPVWPGCLAWPDRTVVEVKAWTADHKTQKTAPPRRGGPLARRVPARTG